MNIQQRICKLEASMAGGERGPSYVVVRDGETLEQAQERARAMGVAKLYEVVSPDDWPAPRYRSDHTKG